MAQAKYGTGTVYQTKDDERLLEKFKRKLKNGEYNIEWCLASKQFGTAKKLGTPFGVPSFSCYRKCFEIVNFRVMSPTGE